MAKKKRFLVLIPSSNKRIRSFRIRLSLIIFLIIIFVIGIAGFFIPFDSLSLDVNEVNQKKYITKQNRALREKIFNMRKAFRTIQRKVDTLHHSKDEMEELIGFNTDMDAQAKKTLRSEKEKKLNISQMLDYVNTTHVFFKRFAEKINENPSYLEYAPLIKPLIDDYVITGRYGMMKDPFTGGIKKHEGIDFSAERETPIIATASGTVVESQKDKNWGRLIKLRHKYGFTTVYAHLGTVKVRKGQKVKKGDVIATVGISGLTTGPHLHYEVRLLGAAVDPEHYFFPDVPNLTASKATR